MVEGGTEGGTTPPPGMRCICIFVMRRVTGQMPSSELLLDQTQNAELTTTNVAIVKWRMIKQIQERKQSCHENTTTVTQTCLQQERKVQIRHANVQWDYHELHLVGVGEIANRRGLQWVPCKKNMVAEGASVKLIMLHGSVREMCNFAWVGP